MPRSNGQSTERAQTQPRAVYASVGLCRRQMRRHNPTSKRLVHPGEFVLPELGQELGRYASRKPAERGVEMRANTKIKAITSNGAELTDGTHIITCTLVWTAGT